jgi:hypothetical protein
MSTTTATKTRRIQVYTEKQPDQDRVISIQKHANENHSEVWSLTRTEAANLAQALFGYLIGGIGQDFKGDK